ncbi:MAG: presenilin family intramembrane aspartyl protease PSH [bacterium]
MEPVPAAPAEPPKDNPHDPPTAKGPPEPVTPGEMRATGVLFAIFAVTIALSVLFAAPFHRAGLQAFANPEDTSNAFVYLAMILAFTFVILWIAKRGKKNIIRAIILFAVGSTIAYVVYPLVALALPAGPIEPYMGFLVIPLVAALAVSIGSVLLLYFHPEWYVIDTVGLLVAAGSAAIFGISFGILPVIVLLSMLAIYDAIAVYRTRHMLALADTVIDLRLPVLLVIPKHAGYKFKDEANKFKQASAENKGEREAMFMGLGDLVMPTMLVVSALTFLGALTAVPLAATVEPWDDAHGLPVDMTAAATPGHPINVQYTISSPSPAASSWNWTLTWADGTHDAYGHGLPAFVTREFQEPGGVVANITVQDASGAKGSVELVAAVDYAHATFFTPLSTLFANPPALGAAIGTLAGFGALMVFVLRGNPQAGLPLLNGGALAGFLLGLYQATGSFKFW